ncbi:MAG: hypothetical protein K5989_06620, partial [Lachnospiraceae bacterium]|nr:hypothetical protein [Lachnospiraceae bacterium]
MRRFSHKSTDFGFLRYLPAVRRGKRPYLAAVRRGKRRIPRKSTELQIREFFLSTFLEFLRSEREIS